MPVIPNRPKIATLKLAQDQCVACRGSGKSSKGTKCVPCQGKGKKINAKKVEQ